MNTKLIQQVSCVLLTASVIFTACNNDKKKEQEKNAGSTAATEQPAPATPAGPVEKAIVSFKVNDTTARTQKGEANDRDEATGIFTEASKQLSLDLMGDVPNRPHRGWLHFGIQNFKFEPATYALNADSYASYTRYTMANAGGSSDYIADKNPVNKGTELTISFTKIEKDPEGNGGTYLASGTFSSKLYNKIYNIKRDSKEEVMISEGTFENIPIMGGPRN
jgi:hypothetical protein